MSEFIMTSIRWTEPKTRFGIVSVYSEDDLLLREYKITPEEAKAVRLSVNDHPSCVTRDEWNTGRVLLTECDVDLNEGTSDPQGNLLICTKLQEKDGLLDWKAYVIPLSNWRRKGDAIYLDSNIIATIGVSSCL